MKNKFKILFVLFLLLNSSFVFGSRIDNYDETVVENLSVKTLPNDFVNQISICKWKNGCATSVCLTFDDDPISHGTIGKIIEKYGWRGTFYVIPSYFNLKDPASTFYVHKLLSENGHEIGNHTWSHQNLTTLDSLSILEEIMKANRWINEKFNIQCISVATPYDQSNKLVETIIFNNSLFSRTKSIYPNVSRKMISIDKTLTLSRFNDLFKTDIVTGKMILIVGHSLDVNESDYSISSELLNLMLGSMKNYENNGDIWVTLLSNAAQYENLFHELNLEKKLVGDTIKLKINNYLKEKYKALDSSPISIEIPTECFGQVRYLNDAIEIKNLPTKDIVTIDLKKSNELSFIIGADNLFISTDPVTISGSTTVCQGQESVIYTVPLIANATSYVWTLPLATTGTSTTNSITLNYGTAAVSGNITAKGTNSCMEGPNSTLFITVNEKPAAPVISLKGNTLHSDATIANQWYNQSGLINGAWGQDFIVNAANDYYNIVSLQGCNSAPSKSIRILQTDIDLAKTGIPVKVYPNPFSNELNFEFGGNTDPLNFEILNSLGQIVFKSSFAEKANVQTSNFAPGIYLIKFETNKTFEIMKFLKK